MNLLRETTECIERSGHQRRHADCGSEARLRRRFRRGLEKVPDTEVVAVTVEPLWKELG